LTWEHLAATADDLDLDHAPPDPPRAGRPSWPAAVLVLVLAALGGAWSHAGLAGGAVTASPQVSAWVGLDAVQFTDHPVAVLHLVVTSHDDVPVYLTSLRVGGAGLVDQEQQLWRPLTPGLVEDLRLPADLACRPGTGTAPLHLALTATRDPPPNGMATTGTTTGATTGTGTTGANGTTVTAVPGGVAQVPGGLCQAVQQQLPQAYQMSMTVRTVSISDDALALAVSGLPPTGTEIFSVQADGWLLPMSAGTVPVIGGAATLTLGPPEPRCDDTGTRDVLPTGLQLVFTGDTTGVHEAYAPVGRALASWLLHARQRVCPS
jgi:hypothetical protein